VSSVPREEIGRRIITFQDKMCQAGIDGSLIVQRADLFYLSGTAQDAHLFVPGSGEPVLLVRKSFERALEDSPLADIFPMDSLAELKKRVDESCGSTPRKLGMELDVLPVNNYFMYRELFPKAEICDCSRLVRETRMIKSDYEINLMRLAAEQNHRMFSTVPSVLKEGMTEMEFAGLLEAFYRKNGHQGHVRIRSFNNEVFYGHVMSGVNLAVPSCSVGPTGGTGPNASMPQGAGTKKIGRHEPIQIDFVGIVDGYMVDQARTFFLGKPPQVFLDVHAAALDIQQAIAQAGVPGKSAEKLYIIAMDMASKAGLTEGFMGYPKPVPFVGHGIGLELDELPLIGRKSPHVLQPGMVVALEPKFILPDKGLAGIENSFLVTDNGFEKLTVFDDNIQIID
jgi:Xaa-Pro dipeptidase